MNVRPSSLTWSIYGLGEKLAGLLGVAAFCFTSATGWYASTARERPTRSS